MPGAAYAANRMLAANALRPVLAQRCQKEHKLPSLPRDPETLATDWLWPFRRFPYESDLI
jgi:hypothetical protein